MNVFENITVYKNQYVKVKKVKVKIPLTLVKKKLVSQLQTEN